MFYLTQYVSLIAPTTAVVAVLLVLVQLLSRVCNPMDCGPPGSSVLQYILDFAQILIHWVGGTIETSHPLLSPSPFAFSLSQQVINIKKKKVMKTIQLFFIFLY